KMALELFNHHLGIGARDVDVVQAYLAHECIPQPRVGHLARMQMAHHELQSQFGGRLMAAGTSYTGVGVLASLRAGRDAAHHIALRAAQSDAAAAVDYGKEGEGGGLAHVGDTGLADYKEPRTWLRIPWADLPFRSHAANSR